MKNVEEHQKHIQGCNERQRNCYTEYYQRYYCAILIIIFCILYVRNSFPTLIYRVMFDTVFIEFMENMAALPVFIIYFLISKTVS